MEWVVRAGWAEPANLQDNYEEHTLAPGVFGFSVQYAPGSSLDDLARAGEFPNGTISYAYDNELINALRPLGLTMELRRTPGRGFHHTFMVLYDANRVMKLDLPDDAAQALAATFRHRDNPHRVRRGQPGRRHP